MTIGYILDDTLDRSDGVQQAVLGIGEHMRSRGHDVHYIVAQTQRTDIKNIHSVGRSISLQFNGNSVRTPRPSSMKAIRTLFEQVNFDVLHVQAPFSPFMAAKVLKHAPSRVRTVSTFHILPYNRFASLGTTLIGKAMRRSIQAIDVHYAVSQPATMFMNRAFGVSGSVLPNPVDYEFFSSFKRQNKSKQQIVFVGRFEERKGVRELVNAYAKIDAAIRDTTELHMISKGPLLDEIKNISHERGLNVSFPGFVSESEKAQFLANADIAVYPSTSGESFGIVLAEAMAAGAGVTIGGNNPGYSSVLEPWPEALFDPKDTQAFSQKLVEMLTDEQLRMSIGSQQHEAVKAYDIRVVCDRLLKEAYR